MNNEVNVPEEAVEQGMRGYMELQSVVSEDAMWRALDRAAPAIRKQERERLREAMLTQVGGNLHRAIREVFSTAEAALDQKGDDHE